MREDFKYTKAHLKLIPKDIEKRVFELRTLSCKNYKYSTRVINKEFGTDLTVKQLHSMNNRVKRNIRKGGVEAVYHYHGSQYPELAGRDLTVSKVKRYLRTGSDRIVKLLSDYDGDMTLACDNYYPGVDVVTDNVRECVSVGVNPKMLVLASKPISQWGCV